MEKENRSTKMTNGSRQWNGTLAMQREGTIEKRRKQKHPTKSKYSSPPLKRNVTGPTSTSRTDDVLLSSCGTRQALSNGVRITKIGVDTAENEPRKGSWNATLKKVKENRR